MAEWQSFLEDTCVGYGVVAKDLYSLFTFEPGHILYLEVLRLLKLLLVHHLSSKEICSQPWGSGWNVEKAELGEAAAAEIV